MERVESYGNKEPEYFNGSYRYLAAHPILNYGLELTGQPSESQITYVDHTFDEHLSIDML